MVLHKVSARRQNVKPYCIASKQSDKLFHNVSYGVIQRKLTADWDAEENRIDKG